MRRYGALRGRAAAIAGDLIDVFTLLPARDALVQSGYLTAAIVTAMALLVLSGERQDALVAELHHQAAIDPLTGLFTRRVLDNAAARRCPAAASELGTGLILLDIDNFKHVNDDYGHPAGDEVLVQLARLLMLGTRPSDTRQPAGRRRGRGAARRAARSTSVCAAPSRSCGRCAAHPFDVDPGISLLGVGEHRRRAPAHARRRPALALQRRRRVAVRGQAGGRDQIGPLPDARAHIHR